ncbi:hypothetical protein [Brevibacillus porteri]|uniref:hypothetical protein n=1 Tax=Brevibacillus porteri TaxID=2126350 RepID=UPI003D1D7BC2
MIRKLVRRWEAWLFNLAFGNFVNDVGSYWYVGNTDVFDFATGTFSFVLLIGSIVFIVLFHLVRFSYKKIVEVINNWIDKKIEARLQQGNNQSQQV